MNLSTMDTDPTASARRPQPRLAEITPTTTVQVARRILAAAGTPTAVVTGHDQPVGIVTSDALAGHDGTIPAPDTPVIEVMDYEVVHLNPATGEIGTVRAYQHAAWTSLYRRRPCASPITDSPAGGLRPRARAGSGDGRWR